MGEIIYGSALSYIFQDLNIYASAELQVSVSNFSY